MADDKTLDLLLRKARTHSDFTDQPVTDEVLRAAHELMKWGPTSANSQPMRILYLRSKESREKVARREVGLAHEGAPAVRRDRVRDLVRAFAGVAVREQHHGALGGIRLGDGTPDPAARAGHDGMQTGQPAGPVQSMSPPWSPSPPRPPRTDAAPPRTNRGSSLTLGSLASARAIASFVAW